MSLAGWYLPCLQTAVLLNLFIPRFYCRFNLSYGAFLAIFEQVLDLAHRQDQKRMYSTARCAKKACEGGCETERQYSKSPNVCLFQLPG